MGQLLGKLPENMRTGFIRAEHPSVWRKMRILSVDGTVAGLRNATRDSLRSVHLSGDDMDALEGFQQWDRLKVPVPLGLAIWSLRSRARANGGIARFAQTEQTSVGTSIRYAELMGLLLESPRATDPLVSKCLDFIASCVESSGGLCVPGEDVPDVGMTSRALRAFALCGIGSHEEVFAQMESFLLHRADLSDGWARWTTFESSNFATGATALAVSALLAADSKDAARVAERAIAWLGECQGSDGGWGEHAGGSSQIDNTFWAVRAIREASGNSSDLLANAAVFAGRAVAPSLNLKESLFGLRLQSQIQGATHGVDEVKLSFPILSQGLAANSDGYSILSVLALALTEARSAFPVDVLISERQYDIPSAQPEFLQPSPQIYEVIGSRLGGQRSLKVLDVAHRGEILETFTGVLIGSLVLISSVSTSQEMLFDSGAVGAILATMVVLAFCGWIPLRLRWLARGWGAAFALSLSVLVAVPISLASLAQVPSGHAGQVILPVILLAILVVDVVGVISDRLDVLSRLARGGSAKGERK